MERRRRYGRWSTLSCRSHSERDGKGSKPCAADLEIEARIGLEEALVGGRAVEQDLAFGPDLGRGDQRGQHIFELGVEIAGDRGGRAPGRAHSRRRRAGPAIHSAEMPIIRRVSEPVRRGRRGAPRSGAGEAGQLHRRRSRGRQAAGCRIVACSRCE